MDSPRAWQRMLSGRRLDLLDPSPLDVEIGDIAHGLSREARWNGQTTGEWAFSVAQHCVLVEQIVAQLRPAVSASWRLAALLHDAPEYVIGDLISPFKAAVGIDYRVFENRLTEAIHVRFGLPARISAEAKALIKRADKASAFLEATQLAGFEAAEARHLFGNIRGLSAIRLMPQPPEKAKKAFLDRFAALTPQVRSRGEGSRSSSAGCRDGIGKELPLPSPGKSGSG